MEVTSVGFLSLLIDQSETISGCSSANELYPSIATLPVQIGHSSTPAAIFLTSLRNSRLHVGQIQKTSYFCHSPTSFAFLSFLGENSLASCGLVIVKSLTPDFNFVWLQYGQELSPILRSFTGYK